MDGINNKSSKEVFSENFRYYLKKSGKSIYQMHKETGITHSYLYDLCNPKKNKKPSMEMIERIANYLCIDPPELLTNHNFNEKEN